ncbi:phosphoenolpyruvate phosphomutase family protein [Collimonas fungivorans]|uniref:Phosphoenolpyruvate phosphomutase family protein n=1 Tax=Collimonas fungivorans TaxID=158899 RepID=A0A127PGC1_9BURK|nr:isocitrate lyase/phosphoenolpyruvate mutase family protein [Collimonas fungivorans]AMO96783.1 phosphoenolpyruvate phosphomutase family protein [Collimonas fungivorans]
MQSSTARKQSNIFHQLHLGPQPLTLLNAWDAASARILERAGAPAIGTTSAGMAWAAGYADGERMPAAELIAACARICRVAGVPVSVDIERGFGRSAEEVCDVVRALVDMGVAGVNIEDGVLPGTGQLAPPEILCERISALRKMLAQMDGQLFINARSDTYFVANDDPVARYEDTVRRAQMYAAAGADGIFVPGMANIDDITRFTQTVSLPVNIYAGYAGAPDVDVLGQAGVRRISVGCGPLQSALGLLQRIAGEALSQGSFHAMGSGMLSGGEINALFPQ